MTVTERDFDVWLNGFASTTREAPPHAISRVFGIPLQAAQAIVETLPRVVKRDAPAEQAERLVRALEAIGGMAEAIPTRVLPAPVLLVGTQPAHLKPETIVRHAPRGGAPRVQAMLESAASSGETLKIGTHELAAYLVPVRDALTASPDTTLVDPGPPTWSDAELARVDQAAPVDHAPPVANAEPRGRWDDIELSPPDQLAAPISIEPPALRSEAVGAWQDPMALPPRDAPLRSIGMRTAAERMRAFGRPRSQHPPSIRPAVSAREPSFTDALMALTRGDLRGMTIASPSLSFAVILIGVTFAFVAAYAAW